MPEIPENSFLSFLNMALPAIHRDGIKAYIYETMGFLPTHHENKKGVLWYRLLNKSSF